MNRFFENTGLSKEDKSPARGRKLIVWFIRVDKS